MRKIKTSEATGAALDWLVAKCEGATYSPCRTYDGIGMEYPAATYSTDWAQGGPIKSVNRISTYIKHDGWWVACVYNLNDEPEFIQLAHDELIAAMRCYVASVLGDEVEVPEELP